MGQGQRGGRVLTDLRRERGEACLSDLRFDEWHAGELDAEGESAAGAHVESCERCRRRKAELDADRQQFLSLSPSPPVRPDTTAEPATLPQKARVISLRVLGGAALSVAAMLALFVALAPGSHDGGETQTVGDRVKGSHRLGFFVKRGGETFEGLSGQRVLPGDQLRFVVTLREPAHLAVLSRDGAGNASVYFPAHGGRAPRLDVASERALDGAVELDGTLGRERIWGVFCAEAFEVEPLRAALETSGALAPPSGCTLDELELTKAASR
jgi:hypothetical protein